jgi:uncharacterized RDD family membrane protein YckC
MKTQQKYAGFWIRLLALMTDYFMLILPMQLLFMLIFGYEVMKEAKPSDPLILLFDVIILLSISYLWSSPLKTPGLKAANLSIVKANTTEPITFIHAILRFIIALGSLIILIGPLFSAFRKDKQTLHDLLAKTQVIHD